jgi:hypothetical protein
MQALAWWDWSHDRLRAALDDFRNLSAEEFLDRHETVRRPHVGVDRHATDIEPTPWLHATRVGR